MVEEDPIVEMGGEVVEEESKRVVEESKSGSKSEEESKSRKSRKSPSLLHDLDLEKELDLEVEEEVIEIVRVGSIEEGINPEPMKDEKDVRIAVIGNVDSGKSTIVGVLTRGELDDGKGSARMKVFNYSHEAGTGRTSSIAHEIMGFSGGYENTQVIPKRATANKKQLWNEITQNSEKLVTFIDLCGHEKYLKTTIFGLVGLMPDYAMVVVGANMGVTRMTKEHLGVSLTLKVPLFIVITKIDLAPVEVKKNTLETLTKILKSQGKTPVTMKETDDVSIQAETLMSNKNTPIFLVSNKTGEGHSQLKQFLGVLKSRIFLNPLFGSAEDKVEFIIDQVFQVPNAGIVVAGTMLSGRVQPEDKLLLGPTKQNDFKTVIVRSIHHKREAATEAIAGQGVCFSIKKSKKKDESLKKETFRKGMVLLGENVEQKIAYKFTAEVMILHHATTIQEKYQAVIHCGVIRQTAEVINVNGDCMRTGDKGIIDFRFMYHPEYLHKGMTILFREGRTKGIGVISNIEYIQTIGALGAKKGGGSKGKGAKGKTESGEKVKKHIHIKGEEIHEIHGKKPLKE